MYALIFKDSAVDDLQKAFDYLEEQEKGLGDKLVQRISEYVEVIESNPYIFKAEYKQIRQVRLKPFQYLLRYKIYKEFVVVIQVFHTKQHPKKKAKN